MKSGQYHILSCWLIWNSDITIIKPSGYCDFWPFCTQYESVFEADVLCGIYQYCAFLSVRFPVSMFLFQHCGSPYSILRFPFCILFFNMVCFKLPSSIKCALTVAMSVKKWVCVCVCVVYCSSTAQKFYHLSLFTTLKHNDTVAAWNKE